MGRVDGRRWIEVAPGRLVRWVEGFAERHDGVAEAGLDAAGGVLTLRGVDGASAECHVPFPPVDGAGAEGARGLAELVAGHAARERAVGVVLVRRGGYAVGVFDGERLTASKVGSRYVQGRTKAGGWSQQRFARRREGQAKELVGAAAEACVRVLLPRVSGLDEVAVGGDARLLDHLRADRRLAPLWSRPPGRTLALTADPRHATLEACAPQLHSIRILINDGTER